MLECKQLQMRRPLGIEGLTAHITFVSGWAWRWAVKEWDGESWVTLDSGASSNWRECVHRVIDCLCHLAKYDEEMY